jgi:hypothetical protein
MNSQDVLVLLSVPVGLVVVHRIYLFAAAWLGYR